MISSFLWLFLIGFCELAGDNTQREWIQSGMLSIGIEMVWADSSERERDFLLSLDDSDV